MDIEQSFLSFALLGASWVMWLLAGLSVLCIAVALERGIFLVLNSTPAAALQAALAAYLRSGDVGGLKVALDQMKGIEARVLVAGVEVLSKSPAAAEEAFAGTLALERSRMSKWLLVLGTVGANAPFIGLFGTVLGIIQAFHELAENDEEAIGAVMAGISEALVATAIGLLVAIPAVVLYNFFQRRNKEVVSRVETLSHSVLARAKADLAGPQAALEP